MKTLILLALGAIAAVAVNLQTIMPLHNCIATGNYFTRCILLVDKTVN